MVVSKILLFEVLLFFCVLMKGLRYVMVCFMICVDFMICGRNIFFFLNKLLIMFILFISGFLIIFSGLLVC